jgi:hypothetical protein
MHAVSRGSALFGELPLRLTNVPHDVKLRCGSRGQLMNCPGFVSREVSGPLGPREAGRRWNGHAFTIGLVDFRQFDLAGFALEDVNKAASAHASANEAPSSSPC